MSEELKNFISNVYKNVYLKGGKRGAVLRLQPNN